MIRIERHYSNKLRSDCLHLYEADNRKTALDYVKYTQCCYEAGPYLLPLTGGI